MKHLVVIGGSAGSLDALHGLFATLPAAPGAAFAIVIHVSPASESLLPAVLGAYTSLPVREAIDKLLLAANQVVIAPPDYHMLVERDFTIALSRDPAEHFSRPAIDPLFDSAASSLGASAIGILLSGSNTDGAAGLAALSAAGARTGVQDPATAASPAMPAAGLAACTPTFVGAPAALGRWIGECLESSR